MTTKETPRAGILGFEDVSEELEWIPLAARRALDASGSVLKLPTWRELPRSARWRLIELGAEEVVDVQLVHGALAGVGRSDAESWREAEQPSSTLLALMGAESARVAELYREASGLERYALEKIASSPRRDEDERRRRVLEAVEWLGRGAATPALSHVDERGRLRMVDVSAKSATARWARASARLSMRTETLRRVADGATPKGDVLATARLAGIQAAKRTAELIPLCHAIALSGVQLELVLDESLPGIHIEAQARTVERTGVEMEALVAVSVAGLTLYDMLKAVDRDMVLSEVRLEEKHGGSSGDYVRGA